MPFFCYKSYPLNHCKVFLPVTHGKCRDTGDSYSWTIIRFAGFVCIEKNNTAARILWTWWMTVPKPRHSCGLRGSFIFSCVYVIYFSSNYVTSLPVVEWTLQDIFLSPAPGSSGLDMSQSADLWFIVNLLKENLYD